MAEKVDGSYFGTLRINDTTITDNTQILIQEIDRKRVSISCSAFEQYQAELDIKRFFAAKIYYSVDPEEIIEIHNLEEMSLLHDDADRNEFRFFGT